MEDGGMRLLEMAVMVGVMAGATGIPVSASDVGWQTVAAVHGPQTAGEHEAPTVETTLREMPTDRMQQEIASHEGSLGSTAARGVFGLALRADPSADVAPKWRGRASGPSNPLALAYFGSLLLLCAGLCIWQAARVERRRTGEEQELVQEVPA